MKYFAEAITAIAGFTFLAFIAIIYNANKHAEPGNVVKVQYADMTKIRALENHDERMVISQPGYENEDVVTLVVSDSILAKMRASKVAYMAEPRKGN